MLLICFIFFLYCWVDSPAYKKMIEKYEEKYGTQIVFPPVTEANIVYDFERIVRSVDWSTIGILPNSHSLKLFIENGDVLSDGTRIGRFSTMLPASVVASHISNQCLDRLKKLINLQLVEEYYVVRKYEDLFDFYNFLYHHPAFIHGILVDNIFYTDNLLVFEVFEVGNDSEVKRCQQILRRLHLLNRPRTSAASRR